MFSEFEEGLDPLGTHIFYEGLVKELAGKEKVFKESVWNNLSQRDIQIIKLDGAVEFVGKEKLSRLIEERKELSLLLRP
jgi:flagellar motor switch protein FliG